MSSNITIPTIEIENQAKDINKPMPEDLEPTFSEACTEFQAKAIDLRKQRPQWVTYYQGQMIDKDECDFVQKFDNANQVERDRMLSNPNEGVECIGKLMSIINKVSKEQTVQYMLTILDDLLQESKQRVELFHLYARKYKENVYAIFQKMLLRQDYYIMNQASRIIAKLACWSSELMSDKDLKDYYMWITEQMDDKNPFKETTCRCLQMMFRIDHYRVVFYKMDGIKKMTKFLESTISKQSKDQIQYQIIFCLWLLTFNQIIAERIEGGYKIIPILADILNASEKEKVKRITLALFRNLLEKPDQKECSDIIRENSLCMLKFKVKKLIEIMQLSQIADQEISDDIEYLMKTLESLESDVSSYDEYSAEIVSGRLSWSPVHKSEKFWRENAARLNENNFYLVKQLVKLLKDESTPSQVLEVAAYDLGEYVRYYMRGKNVIEQLDGKSAVMALLTHDDMNVRHQALLCIQKLMVHHWEYLQQSASASAGNQPTNSAIESLNKPIQTKA